MKIRYLVLFTILTCYSLNAEITTDGSLGNRVNLTAPDYQITQNLGKKTGDNLFHSFETFNIFQGESATFSGDSNISNVISRVTGGESSTIDGVFRNTIPNSDTYFINPAGVLFGKNVRLDVQGSFHVSTADYLRLGDNEKFYANLSENSVLSVVSPNAFGFLSDFPQSISTQNSILSVPYSKTLSLIGGNLELTGKSPIIFDERGFIAVFADSSLSAQGGRINLASAMSKGEIIPSESGLVLNADGGTISFEKTLIETSGLGSGSVFVRGGQLLMQNSSIQANTIGEQNGKSIDMKLSNAVKMNGDLLVISSNTFNKGNAGHITVTSPLIEISESIIHASTMSEARAGDITIKSGDINLFEGATIANDSFASGSGGQLEITATGQFLVSDQRLFLDKENTKFSTGLSSGAIGNGDGGHLVIHAKQLILDGGVITTNTHQAGKAGKIIINADKLEVINGGIISATALSQAQGRGGNIEINVSDTLHLSGFRLGFTKTTTDFFQNIQSGIAALTFGEGAAGNVSILAKNIAIEDYGAIGSATGGSGTAGHTLIQVDDLYMKSGGIITTGSGGIVGGNIYLGTGAGGTLKVIANGNITISGYSDFSPSGLFSNTLVSGEGGNLEIKANYLILNDNATISANSLGIGKAGNVKIQANAIEINNHGNISTSAEYASGGNISVSTQNTLYLNNAQITTSVGSGTGDGGNITLNPKFVVMDNGKIIARAVEGHGGNIDIETNGIYKFPPESASFIDASSQFGVSGEVDIESPDVDVSSNLLVLSADVLNASGQIQPPCSVQLSNNKSSFVVKKLYSSSPSPDDWQFNVLVLLPENDKQPSDFKNEISSLDTMKAIKIACSKNTN